MLRVGALRLVALVLVSSGAGASECEAGRSTEIADEATVSKNSSGREYLVEYSDYMDLPNFKKHETGRFDYYNLEVDLEAKDCVQGRIVVHKCCSWNHYFDVDTLQCVRFRNDAWNFTESEFFLSKITESGNETGYSFVKGIPACGNLSVLTIRTVSKVEVDSRGVRTEGGQPLGHYCIDENPEHPGETIVLACENSAAFCRSHRCLWKCCPLGESFVSMGACRKSNAPFTPEFFDLTTLARNYTTRLSHFGIRFGDACGFRGKHLLEEDMDEANYLGWTGELYVPLYEKRFSSDEFCMENVRALNTCTFLCFPKTHCFQNSSLQFLLMSLGFILSCMCLTLTFLVYLFSPKSQNLHGKILMCYIACLFTAYLSLAVAELKSRRLVGTLCIVLGHSIIFSFLAAFFWLNVMSYDIWKTFRSDRSGERSVPNRRKKVQFLKYSAYAWTFPSVITVACAVVNQIPDLCPDSLRPGIGEESCWFSRDKKGIYAFFIAPITVIITCNVVFYVHTAWKIWKVKSDIGKMEKQTARRFSANREQFMINGKLFVVMGITWSLEIVSHFAPHPIWYITDAANALHGVFIFAVFVLKKKVVRRVSEGLAVPLKRTRQLVTGNSEDLSTRKNLQDSKTSTTGTTPVTVNEPGERKG